LKLLSKSSTRFDPIHFSNLLYSFATLRLPGPPGILSSIAESAAEHVHRFDAGNLAIASWALAMLGMKEQHLLDLAIDRVAGLVVYDGLWMFISGCL